MKNYFYIALFCVFAINSLHSQSRDKAHDLLYIESVNLRQNGETEESLKLLFSIKCCHLGSLYSIAEIYLNEVKNPNIALDYYRKTMETALNHFDIVINEVDDTVSYVEDDYLLCDICHSPKNLYRKSLFMEAYIYSNYLDMYSKGNKTYQIFIDKFPEDELVESVKYEMGLLKGMEENKNKMLLQNFEGE